MQVTAKRGELTILKLVDSAACWSRQSLKTLISRPEFCHAVFPEKRQKRIQSQFWQGEEVYEKIDCLFVWQSAWKPGKNRPVDHSAREDQTMKKQSGNPSGSPPGNRERTGQWTILPGRIRP